MAAQNTLKVGIEKLPLNNWVQLNVMHDGAQPYYSLQFNGIEALLFDTMHVDALFHRDDDPLKEFYPSIESIVAQLTDKNLIVNLREAAEISNLFGSALEALRENQQEYAKTVGRIPPGTVKESKIFELYAGSHRNTIFDDMADNIAKAASAAQRQLNFLTELAKKGNGEYSQKLQSAVNSYISLQSALRKQEETLAYLSQEYDREAQRVYVRSLPFKKFGNAPSVQKNTAIGSFLQNLEFARRPFLAYAVGCAREDCLRGIAKVAEQARIASIAAGHYSTNPEMRNV